MWKNEQPVVVTFWFFVYGLYVKNKSFNFNFVLTREKWFKQQNYHKTIFLQNKQIMSDLKKADDIK